MLSLTPLLLPVGYLAYISFELARIDIREHRLPNHFTLRAFLLTALAIAVTGLMTTDWQRFASALLTALAALMVTLLLSIGGGLGMGDVKLMLSLNLLVGYLAPWLVALSNGLAAITAAVWGSWLWLAKRKRSSQLIAFGPFLLIGFFVTLVYALIGRIY